MSTFPRLEEIRKKQIIDATLLAISTTGIANITMRDVAHASGLSNGGIAHYFKSKEELFKTAFKEFYDSIFVRAKDEIDNIEDPMEKLLGYGAFFDTNESDLNIGYPLIFDCMSIAVHDDDYKAIFAEWLQNWVNLLRDSIIQGIEKNIFVNVDPDATARTISSIYLGISIRWYLARSFNSTEWAMASFKEAIISLMAPYRVEHL